MDLQFQQGAGAFGDAAVILLVAGDQPGLPDGAVAEPAQQGCQVLLQLHFKSMDPHSPQLRAWGEAMAKFDTVFYTGHCTGEMQFEVLKEIQNYVKQRTAPYKYPRIVEFREELPKTISGKIIRNKL